MEATTATTATTTTATTTIATRTARNRCASVARFGFPFFFMLFKFILPSFVIDFSSFFFGFSFPFYALRRVSSLMKSNSGNRVHPCLLHNFSVFIFKTKKKGGRKEPKSKKKRRKLSAKINTNTENASFFFVFTNDCGSDFIDSCWFLFF